MKNKNNHKNRRGRGARNRGDFTGERVRTIRGQQLYVAVTNGSNGTKLFGSANAVVVSPDSFGTEIADLANHFNQYKFTSLEFEYKPSLYNMTSEGPTGSQSNNLFAFGYESDGEVTFTITHANIASLQHSIVVPASGYQNARQNTLVVKPKDQWYYTKDNTTDSATIRFTIQGLLFGEAFTSISTSTTYGEIRVRYTVKFRDLCPTQGVTLTQLARELRMGRTTNLLMLTEVLEYIASGGKNLAMLSNESLHCLKLPAEKPKMAWEDEQCKDGDWDTMSIQSQLSKVLDSLHLLHRC